MFTVDAQEHLTDAELEHVMEIIVAALDRSYEKGLIEGDVDSLEVSIKAHIPKI
tara:strand:- start:2904 stop:3065 length:162 start_codon:yes stop_codon:yes gene_type:complete